jgi:hypothetical protein
LEKISFLKKVLGKIAQVDADNLTLNTDDGLTRTFSLDPNAEITDESFCRLPASDLKNGQRVVVSYSVENNGPLIAKMIMSFIRLQR